MSDDNNRQRPTSGFSSPPCYAADLAADYFDPLHVDPQQALDVARWRKSERIRLRSERQNLSAEDRKLISTSLMDHLRELLQARFKGARNRVLSAYWPIKAEPDLRPLMTELHQFGVSVALPIVETRAAPLTFRRWIPGMAMVRRDWNIPVPPREAQELTPEISLAPLVGWTADGYRLGYGGGYFDRTLAALTPRPFTIGIGYEFSRLDTIFPQPHDIRLDVIITEAGVRSGQAGNRS